MGSSLFQLLSARLHPAVASYAPANAKPLPRSMLIKASLILLASMLAGVATAAEQARRSGTDNPLLHPPSIHLQLSHGSATRGSTNSVPSPDTTADTAGDVSDTTATDNSPSAAEVAASYAAAAAVSPVLNRLAGTPTPSGNSVVTTTSSSPAPAPASTPAPQPDPAPQPAPADPAPTPAPGAGPGPSDGGTTPPPGGTNP